MVYPYNPIPLGPFQPTSTLPVPLLSNNQDLAYIKAHSVDMQAPASNRGLVVLGIPGCDPITLNGVLRICEPGYVRSIGNMGNFNTIDLTTLWVAVSYPGDIVLVSAHYRI